MALDVCSKAVIFTHEFCSDPVACAGLRCRLPILSACGEDMHRTQNMSPHDFVSRDSSEDKTEFKYARLHSLGGVHNY